MLRTLQRVRSGPSMGRSPRTKLLAMVAALALLLPIGIGLGSAIAASRAVYRPGAGPAIPEAGPYPCLPHFVRSDDRFVLPDLG